MSVRFQRNSSRKVAISGPLRKSTSCRIDFRRLSNMRFQNDTISDCNNGNGTYELTMTKNDTQMALMLVKNKLNTIIVKVSSSRLQMLKIGFLMFTISNKKSE